MLSTVGNVFFEVTSISRAKGNYIPTVYLSMRNVKTGKMIGQMRFNADENYFSSDVNRVRMAFNLMNAEIINPETLSGNELLEEIVAGGLIWASMDNHYLFPKQTLPYVVVHDYAEDSSMLNMINAKMKSILVLYGCEEVNKYVFEFIYSSVVG